MRALARKAGIALCITIVVLAALNPFGIVDQAVAQLPDWAGPIDPGKEPLRFAISACVTTLLLVLMFLTPHYYRKWRRRDGKDN